MAWSAQRLGVAARIFVPEIASPTNVAAIRAAGSEVVIGGARYADAQEACDRFVAGGGALCIHPFDAKGTIAGQGTVALDAVHGAVPVRGWFSRKGRRTCVVAMHGLGGEANSSYLVEFARAAWDRGHDVLRLGMRGSDGRGDDVYQRAPGVTCVTFRESSSKLSPPT